MAETTNVNGESIYTKPSIDRQMSSVESALASEIAERQSRDEQQEANLTSEITNRTVEDGKLDTRLAFLETLIGKDGIRDAEGNLISIKDFYMEFLKERKDRQTEDANIEAEFEKYLKYHGPQELVTRYEQLKELPWIAYRDENGRLQIKELHGNKDKPFDLTHIFTLTSYEQLERKPWFIFKDGRGRVVKKELRGGKENALDLEEFAKVNDYDTLVNRPYFKYKDEHGEVHLVEIVGGPDDPVDLTLFAGVSVYNDLMGKPYVKYISKVTGRLVEKEIVGGQENAVDLTDLFIDTELTVKKYADSEHWDEHAQYDNTGEKVPVSELELTAMKDEEIVQLFDEVN